MSAGSSGEKSSIILLLAEAEPYQRSVYVGCPSDDAAGPDFLNATWRVR
jgi:hypothetical protein